MGGGSFAKSMIRVCMFLKFIYGVALRHDVRNLTPFTGLHVPKVYIRSSKDNLELLRVHIYGDRKQPLFNLKGVTIFPPSSFPHVYIF
ncbi:hypothetical protein NC653_025911 [Populus alba x Populus x berolinensis]|uniref:Uncharacterized protein n=1 Tax=Populus alba x Populus x berolinensis TaxID=444605 RepID=A0AAD6MCD7_9ROSI|nr:hypothetical protein NC653_025911 [Populus alba x Populus x berolinensis]